MRPQERLEQLHQQEQVVRFARVKPPQTRCAAAAAAECLAVRCAVHFPISSLQNATAFPVT
jgi:hypothetical protein